MKIIATERTDEVVVTSAHLMPGMVIAADYLTRPPREIYLVTEVTVDCLVRGIYLGEDKTRSREQQNILGCVGNVLLYPRAVLCLHGVNERHQG